MSPTSVIELDEFIGICSKPDGDAMLLNSYFDDSGDDKRKQFAAVGGLLGVTSQWQAFHVPWSVATYDLKGPFHSADCESQQGIFKGWAVDKSTALIKRLLRVLEQTRLMGFGAIVPIGEYRDVFPNSKEYDPYFLALKQTIINMGYICRLSGGVDTITICHEKASTSARAFEIYDELKNNTGWCDAKYLVGFSVGDKTLGPLQAADLIAREAFKHAQNLGIRKTRKPVKALQNRLSFHLWSRASLEYLKTKGGPNNIEALTTWGQRGEAVPQMTNWFNEGFNRLSGNLRRSKP